MLSSELAAEERRAHEETSHECQEVADEALISCLQGRKQKP